MSQSSKEFILTTLKTNKPAEVPLPEIDQSIVLNYEDLTSQFCEVLQKIGGYFKLFNSLDEILKDIKNESINGFNINTFNLSDAEKKDLYQKSSYELEALDKTYIRGELGVAENGAIWINENTLPNRIIPFICQHLIIVLDAKSIVSTLHEAYNRLSFDNLGFGAFIAGPSKTADIEQSLVVGAHGARSLTVYLYNC
ncbi:LutC/YkgG family protein [Pseudopedobacter beijingensis]|uniref:Lactate utilization protein C n=1 Tax=Pseudopedobacter beijingensis TaxID=1207056 RepID=A0ABW4IF35_9SPHI